MTFILFIKSKSVKLWKTKYNLGYGRKIRYVKVSTRKHNIFSLEDALKASEFHRKNLRKGIQA